LFYILVNLSSFSDVGNSKGISVPVRRLLDTKRPERLVTPREDFLNPFSDQLRGLFNRLARLAALTTKSPVTLVTLRIDRKLHILGQHGLYLKTFDDSWNMGAKLVRKHSIVFVPNVYQDPNLEGHPLLKAAPFTRSIAHVPVQGEHADIEAAIGIINPDVKWPFSATTTAILTDLAMLIGDALKSSGALEHYASQCEATGSKRGMSEPQTEPSKGANKDTAGQFLLSTLTRRTSIRTKTKLSYATLRTWTKLIKDHQISALKIVKQDADQAFVDGVALEIVDHFRNMFGIPAFTGVVPVPCGHSGTNNCLSVRISKSVSELMSVPFLDILEHTARPGKSHPSKNAKLVAPKLLVNERLGPVLLVDDVATSGRHIELAVQSLRAITDQVSAVAWIGAN
jgi:hypothetical protein